MTSFFVTSLFCDIFKTSQTHLKNRCLFCDVFETSKIHLEKEIFHVTSLRRLKYISKKDVYSVKSLLRLKNTSKEYLWLFKNIPTKLFCSNKIVVEPLKRLKKLKDVFWEQCIDINQPVVSISGLIFACLSE